MTYDQVIEANKKCNKLLYGYMFDDISWLLFILDPTDDTYPEPQVYDIILDTYYKDAQHAATKSKTSVGWWVSTVQPKESIRQWRQKDEPVKTIQAERWQSMGTGVPTGA